MDWEMGNNVTEWKLVDVPELGYLTTDRPFPRGELLIKTHSLIKGYYKHPKVRCQAQWFHSCTTSTPRCAARRSGFNTPFTSTSRCAAGAAHEAHEHEGLHKKLSA